MDLVLLQKFYGPITPAVSLKALKESAKPTSKEAFDEKTTPVNAQEKNYAAKKKGKKCTVHFGCPNIAVYSEK